MRHLTLGAFIGMAAGFLLTVLSRAGTVSVDEVWDDVGLAMRVNGRVR